jgi:glutamate dehydrogenase
VLLAYSKIALYQQLLDSDVPEDPYLSRELERYFPAAVARRFGLAIPRHRLRREIIATATTNSLVNRMGPTFVPRAMDDTGAQAGQVARAYSVAREVFELRDRWAQIETLDNRVPAAVQHAMHGETARLLRHGTYWLLRHRRGHLDVDAAVRDFGPPVAALTAALPGTLAGEDREAWQRTLAAHEAAGVPQRLATFMAATEALGSAFDIVGVAAARRAAIDFAASAYFHAGARLGLDWLRGEIERLAVEGPWQAVARSGLRDAALQVQRGIAAQVLATPGGGPVASRIERWLARHAADFSAWQRTLADMRATGTPDFATLSVGIDAVRKLVG